MGETEDSAKPKKIVFVTVGTTCFDALVRAMDTQVVKEELLRRGYTHLLIQMGRGSYVPAKVSLHFGLSYVISCFCFNRERFYYCCFKPEWNCYLTLSKRQIDGFKISMD